MFKLPISIPEPSNMLTEKRVCKFKLYNGKERRIKHICIGEYVGANRRIGTDRRKK